MGAFDTVWLKDKQGEEIDLQFKSGECCQMNYEIGDKIELWDGVHFDHDGCFVVYNGIIVAAFAKNDEMLFNKWGGKIKHPELDRCITV